jgi:membrane protein involved in colicin uptake
VAGKLIAEKIEQHDRERGILLEEIASGELREQELASQNKDLRIEKAAAEQALAEKQVELDASRHHAQRVEAQLDESRKNLDNLVRGLGGGQAAKQGGSKGSGAASDLFEQASGNTGQSAAPKPKRGRGRPRKTPAKPAG